MKVTVFGDNKSEAEELLKKLGFELVPNNPEFVVSYGGDGTLMKSEFAYPSIPKIVLKDSLICKVCSKFSNEEVLAKIQKGSYEIKPLIKLEATAGGRTVRGMNDIIVHNADHRHGIRYQLWTDERQLGGTIIGDGIVVATPFGSTAYYRSITDSTFETGIGLAFNNSTEQMDHVVLEDSKTIKVKIVRGPAVVYADNQEECLRLKEEDEIVIKKSIEIAQWVVVK
jgi:NAD+ kinase